MKTENVALFETTSVRKAVLTMAVPMIISQTITIIYNVADTFFVGQLNDPDQIAAVTLSLPLFYLLTALTNLLGVGGSSMVSRFLGQSDSQSAKRCAAFCIWTSIGISLLYGLLVYFLRPSLLPAIGADADTYQYTYEYVFWTITVGAVPTVLNPMLANLIRAEGYSRQASFGVALGGILNVILDPVFIFVLGLQIAGAAIATMLSAWFATLYFFVFLWRRRKTTAITLHPKYYTLNRKISLQTLLIGVPSFVISFMATLSNTVLNPLIAAYSNEALAGMGIAKKIDMLSFAIAQGMSQGTLPLISYNYASGNRKRMLKIVRTALVYGLAFAFAGMALLLLGAAPISRSFIEDAATAGYSEYFIRVISLTCPTTVLILIVMSVFQGTGKKTASIFLSFLRKGTLDIPLMYLLNSLYQIHGVVWAIPLADFLALAVAALLFVPYVNKLRKTAPAAQTLQA